MKKFLFVFAILAAFVATANPVVKKEVMSGFVAIVAPIENQTLVVFTARFTPSPKKCWYCEPMGPVCGTSPYACCYEVPCK
jgi:hypothetical protein